MNRRQFLKQSSAALVTLAAAGYVPTTFAAAQPKRVRLIGGGLRASVLHAASPNVDLLRRHWGLVRPLDARVPDSLVVLDTVRFETGDGSGSVTVAGALPRKGSGDLTVTALGIQLRDLYALAQRSA